MASSRRTLLVGIALAGLLAAIFVGGLLMAPRTRADVELTVDPAMSKGPAQAGVTIVEFSDYQ